MSASPWIDTHCHLDAAEFDADREAVVRRARAAGVATVIIPAVEARGFAAAARCAHDFGFHYALGIHPLAVDRARPADLACLRRAAEAALGDARFVGIGEIGLDALPGAPSASLQESLYREQLRIAAELELPVILHVRRSADRLLFHLRRHHRGGGIAHAFNGSEAQAAGFMGLGFALGFGGACTYDGSLRIRHLARSLPAEHLVLETDAPDIPPQWLRRDGRVERNEPAQIARIAAQVAGLRACSLDELSRSSRASAERVLPRLRAH